MERKEELSSEKYGIFEGEGRDVCEDREKKEYDKNTGKEGRAGKGGSVSILISKKGRKPSLRNALCPNFTNVVGLMITPQEAGPSQLHFGVQSVKT